ncbi:MAG: Ig domain-containing protein [Lachnospiraceae bacterium]|nr:Ig domain-containing protein [Lachnospiraceae bacterium]
MTELKWNAGSISLRKVFAFLLAICMCVSSIGMNVGAAGANETTARETVQTPDQVQTPDVPTPEKPVTKVTLNTTSLTLTAGESATLTATVTPGDATNKTIKWSSSNPNVAAVSGGKVTAVSAGEAVITAEAGNQKATCKVNVKAKEPVKPPVVAVTKIVLNKTSMSLKVGASETLRATVTPANATDKTITWSSSNTKIATVDKTGKVKAASSGTARITAKTSNGKTAVCTVTVTKPVVKVTSVKLNRTKLTLNKGKTVSLKATVNPSGATNKRVSWKSSNTKVATVDKNGKVKAVSKGTATITVTTADGSKRATCKVTVKIPATKISVNTKQLYIQKGKRATIKATMGPVETTDKITVKVSNKNVTVKAGKNGEFTITGKKNGKATVTLTTTSGKRATVSVSVEKRAVKAKSVKLNKKNATLVAGKTITLKAAINPKKTTDTLSWKSSNKKVATVDKFGVVTAKKAGTATITVTTSSGKTAKCKITVPGVTLQKKSATIKVRKTVQIKVKSTIVKKDTIKSCRSSNSKVAKVDKKGKVTGVKAGTATITVTMKSGATATFKVTVKK